MKLAFVGKKESGKTYACNYLGLNILSFAEPVKKIAHQLGWDGKKDNKGRKALQLIGTDIGRMLDPDIWVKRFLESYKEYNSMLLRYNLSDQYIIQDYYFDPKNGLGCDDCRFNNEAELLKEKGFTIIHLSRPRPLSWWIKEIFTLRILRSFHKSERGIDKKYIDYYIKARNIEELTSKLDQLMEELCKS